MTVDLRTRYLGLDLRSPIVASAAPRNTIFGHLIGAVSGYLSLLLFGLSEAAPALTTGVTVARVGAAALSLGLTSGLMVWLRVPHPPAGIPTGGGISTLPTPARMVIREPHPSARAARSPSRRSATRPRNEGRREDDVRWRGPIADPREEKVGAASVCESSGRAS